VVWLPHCAPTPLSRMLTLAGKERQLVVPTPHDTLDVLSQADNAHNILWHCIVKLLLSTERTAIIQAKAH